MLLHRILQTAVDDLKALAPLALEAYAVVADFAAFVLLMTGARVERYSQYVLSMMDPQIDFAAGRIRSAILLLMVVLVPVVHNLFAEILVEHLRYSVYGSHLPKQQMGQD